MARQGVELLGHTPLNRICSSYTRLALHFQSMITMMAGIRLTCQIRCHTGASRQRLSLVMLPQRLTFMPSAYAMAAVSPPAATPGAISRPGILSFTTRANLGFTARRNSAEG